MVKAPVRRRLLLLFALGVCIISVYQLGLMNGTLPVVTLLSEQPQSKSTNVANRDHNHNFVDPNPIVYITFDPSKGKGGNNSIQALPPLRVSSPPKVLRVKTTSTSNGAPPHESALPKHNPAESPPNDKPLNIVLLYADDWSYESLGAAGNAYVQTPYLDRMAKDGILFTHNCVVASVCMQSRATLYTGQYSSRHQTYFAYRNITMYEEGKWNQTLYPAMKRAGYHVGFFGKYHHTEDLPRDVPTFDEFIPMPFAHYVSRYGNVTKHITEWNELDAMKFLRNKPKDKPFFLTVSFFATHAQDGAKILYDPMASSLPLYQEGKVPLPKTYTEEHWEQLPKFFDQYNVGRGRFMERYGNHSMYDHNMKNMYRMVTEVDAACGRIIQHLEDTGELDNTLVIFTTDNGNLHGQHGLAEKWYAYEESLRVPLIIHDPRTKKPAVISDFTLNIDLAPTILSAAGVAVPEVMQGTDMADLYLRKQSGRKEFLYEFWDDNPDIINSLALVQKDFKYIYWNDFKYHQAFNLTADPFEENDLFHSISKETYESVQQRMSELQASIRMGKTQ